MTRICNAASGKIATDDVQFPEYFPYSRPFLDQGDERIDMNQPWKVGLLTHLLGNCALRSFLTQIRAAAVSSCSMFEYSIETY